MKNLLILFSLIFIFSCGNDTVVNNNGGNPAADFDIYMSKSVGSTHTLGTYTINSDGSGFKIFNDSLAIASQSKNGKILLVKFSIVNMVSDIYYADENGRNITKIPFQQLPTYVDLSPDASKILFTVNTNASLDVANLDCSAPVRLSNNIFETSYIPKFSPSGNKVAYFETTSGSLQSLFIINSDGTNKKLLQDSMSIYDFYSLDWSPDGGKLVYHHNFGNGSNSQICIIDTSGNGYVILTDGINPTWSPTGDKICYLKLGNMGAYDIHIMNSDGTGILNITYTPNDYDLPGKWSRDGNKILYMYQILSSLPRPVVYDLNSNSSTIIQDSVYGTMWK